STSCSPLDVDVDVDLVLDPHLDAFDSDVDVAPLVDLDLVLSLHDPAHANWIAGRPIRSRCRASNAASVDQLRHARATPLGSRCRPADQHRGELTQLIQL